MDIKFSDEQLHQVITKAIFDTLSSEQREEILKKAVSSLLEPAPSRDHYGPKKTQLQVAYERAAYVAAEAIIREEMKNDETFKVNVKKLYVDAMAKAFAGGNYETLVNKTVGSIVEALSGGR